MRRSIELEVDGAGGVTWPEGRVELAAAVAAAIAKLPARTLVFVSGEYVRPNRETKILRVTTGPDRVTLPIERGLRAWHRPDDLPQFRDAIDRDTSGDGYALRAGLAAAEGRNDDARAYIREAIRLGVSREGAAPLSAAWSLAQPIELTAELEDALLQLAWRDGRAWPGWIDEVAHAAHQAVVPRDQQPAPWHFGGPRVRRDRQLVIAWLEALAAWVATPVDGAGVPELRAMTVAQRRSWLAASESRDERARRDASAAALRNHPRDSEHSPPDDAGDPGELEGDQPLLVWLRYTLAEDPQRDETLARELVRALHRCVEPAAARSLALALDAVVILSAVAPERARKVDRVVLARPALRGGFAIVRAGDAHVMIRAPRGAFGAWEVIDPGEPVPPGGEPTLDLLAEVPPQLRDRARAAMASHDAYACDVVVERPARPKPTAPAPPPAAERFVVHAKFGRGRVVGARDGKLDIEFAGGTRRLLLEKFVTDDAS